MRKFIIFASSILSCFTLLICFASHVAAQTPNPVPYLNQPALPDSVAPGGPSFTLTVTGSAFVSGAHVNWNGSPRATIFVSVTQLTATILVSDIAHASTATITVTNSAPGGGTSNFQFLTIISPVSSPAFARVDQGINTVMIDSVSQVLVGDFNNDGKADLAIVGTGIPNCESCTTGAQTVCIYLGSGNGTFNTPSCTETGIQNSGGLTQQFQAADINGDGKLDIIGADSDPNVITVLLGNGDGTLQAAKNTSVSSNFLLYLGGVADFNRDGKLDVVVGDYPAGNSTSANILFFPGNGDGTFGAPSTVYSSTGLSGPLIGDFNRDGKMDLIIGDSSGSFLLLGNGDGTFQAPQTLSGDTGQLAADFNNDGNLDLFAAVSPSSTVDLSVALGNGNGTFQASLLSPFTSSINPGALADLNGDAKLDYVAVGSSDTNPNQLFLAVSLGNGDGTFQAPLSFPLLNNNIGSVAVGDFNGDGKMDVVTLNQGTITNVSITYPTISLDIQGTFPTAQVSPTTLDFSSVVPGHTSTQQVTLSNSGNARLAISSISLTGTNASEFSQTNNCGSSLAANASCIINVTVTSEGGGNISASLVITDNSSNSPQTVSLTAIAPDFTITANTSSSVTVNPGQSATYGVTATSVGPFMGSVTLTCGGAPSGSNCTVSPGSVSININSATATVTVSTTPNTSAILKFPSFFTPANQQMIQLTSVLLVLSLLVLLTAPRPQKKLATILATVIIAASLLSLAACGGGGGSGSNGNGTPAGTYTITITGKYVGGTTLTHTKNLTLVVK